VFKLFALYNPTFNTGLSVDFYCSTYYTTTI